jgi:transcription initiation factor TFIID subunit 2
VRIHEADGAPYEHVVDIREPTKRFDLPFNTKYKRTRRTGRILARPILAVGEGDEEPEEVMAPEEDNNVFNLPMWEEDEQREKWRVGDWSEADAERIMTEGYEWIRIDPECDWLAKINFQQDPWYWVSQLGRDHDVVAQLEVCYECQRFH